jgi:hypothetical protein
MLNSGILDVVIGLMLVYILLALICTAVNEILETWLKVRAVELERGVRELLNEQGGGNLAQRLYDHPLIYSLFNGNYDPSRIKKNGKYKKGSTLPSYIPARNFALAVMDMALPGTPQQASGAQGATSSQSTASGVSITAPGSVAVNIAPQPLASAAPAANHMEQLKSGLASLENPHVERALRTLIDAAGNDVAQARTNIEQWFDSAMDRVSGRYKRHAQKVTLIVAAIVVAILNADTIMFTQALTEDTSLRQSLVSAAQEYAKANAQSETAPKKDMTSVALVRIADDTGGSAESKPAADEPPACIKDAGSAECKLERNARQLRKLGLPLGWTVPDQWRKKPQEGTHQQQDRTDQQQHPSDERGRRTDFPTQWGAWVLKFFGLLTTMIAITLGAPFWFDALNKVMVVRATVKPKEKSPDEPPVDRDRSSR